MHPVVESPQSPVPSQSLGPDPVDVTPLDTAVSALVVTAELLPLEAELLPLELVPPMPEELVATWLVEVTDDVPPAPPAPDSTTAVPPQPMTVTATNHCTGTWNRMGSTCRKLEA